MNNIKQYNRCIICKTKKDLSKSKLCGDQLCIRLFFLEIHKHNPRKDNTLILYLVCNDSKYKNGLKNKLKSMDKKDLGCLFRSLKRNFNKIYKDNLNNINKLR